MAKNRIYTITDLYKAYDELNTQSQTIENGLSFEEQSELKHIAFKFKVFLDNLNFRRQSKGRFV
jgi:hypothetical protein